MKYGIFLLCLSFLPLKATRTEAILHWKSDLAPTFQAYYAYYDQFRESLEDWSVFEKNDTIFATTDWKSLKNTLPFKLNIQNTSLQSRALLYGVLSIVEVEDGFLVAANEGEFASNLTWFSKDGAQSYLIGDRRKPANADSYFPKSNKNWIGIGNFNKILKYKNQIYGVTGLAHMTDGGGALIKIEKWNQKWVIKVLKKLDSTATFLAFDEKDDFLVGTHNGLYKIDKTFNVENLTKGSFWKHSDSYVKKDSILYTGIRLGVLKVNLNTRHVTWLRPI
jgi:hypothetical protein